MRFQNKAIRARGRAILAWTVAGVTLALLAATANAAVVTVSSTAPVVDGADIAVLTTPGTHTDKWWSDTTNHGQTFTTGNSDVFLNSFTFQTSSVAPATKTYSFRVGSVSGTSFSTIAMESAQQTVNMAANDYITFEFSNPILLSANTHYGIDGEMTGSTTGWQSGIPYIWYHRSDLYSEGARYTRADGDPATISVSSGWDRVFHLDLESASWLKGELGILDVSGTNPATGEPWKYGDTYRLAFITSESTTATSADIDDYNAFVQDLADDAGLGGTWKAIGSTSDVDARDNTSTNPTVETGSPILLVDGSTVIATDNADLWDGEIQNIINLTEDGDVYTHWPFTGTHLDGTEAPGHGASFGALGDGGQIHQGRSDITTEWIWRMWTGASSTSELRMYAMSTPLSVVPEPSSAMLVLLGLIGLLMVRRKR